MSQASDSDQLTLPVTGRDHTQGSLDAPVVLVEYGDYQCPQCGQAHSTVKEIQQRLGDQLCFVFRHFPLIKLHSQAQKAAKVAEVAAIQDKFWQMHNILFEHQHALDDAALVQYAIDIKLDITRFLRDMAEHIYVKRVQEGINSGISSSVSSTPSFFINGVRHEGTWDRESLLAVIGEVGNAQDY